MVLCVWQAASAILVSSEFTSGTDGWTLVNWDGGEGQVGPAWFETGGNPGGYIWSNDVHGAGPHDRAGCGSPSPLGRGPG